MGPMSRTGFVERAAAVAYLRRLGAAETPHLTTDLLTHLLGTEAILRDWDAPGHVQLAGLCHAIYGTDGSPHPLAGLDARPDWSAAIGPEAEALVYLYGSCDRGVTHPALGAPAVPFRDRFDGSRFVATPTQMAGFALVTVANELDLVRRGALDEEWRDDVADLFDRLVPYAGDRARAAAAEVRGAAG